MHEQIAAGLPVAHLYPPGGGDRRFAVAVDVVRGDHLADSRIAAPDVAFELEGERYLLVGQERDQLLPPEIGTAGSTPSGNASPACASIEANVVLLRVFDERLGRSHGLERPV